MGKTVGIIKKKTFRMFPGITYKKVSREPWRVEFYVIHIAAILSNVDPNAAIPIS